MEAVLSSHGCTMQGGWVARSPHVSFVLVDAPNSHAVDSVVVELGLADWNIANIYPVQDLQEAMEELSQQQL